MRRRHGTLRRTAWLASRDFAHEWRISVCLVLALTAVLAPLLILFGLKFGLVDTIARRLIEDRRSREITLLGSGRFLPRWFEEFRRDPNVGYIIPSTRAISAGFNALESMSSGNKVRGVAMIPTSKGDPQLAGLNVFPLKANEVVISFRVAEKLRARAGETVRGYIQRRRNGRAESVSVDLIVKAIAPQAAESEEAAFLALPLLIDTEDYRDGFAVPARGWAGSSPQKRERLFPKFRVYASSIYSVAALREKLVAQGLEVRTRADEIELMQTLDRNLGRIFWMLASIGTVGFLAALGANLAANVERKRKDLSILRILGLPTHGLMLFPTVQALFVAVGGVALAGAIYLLFARVLNVYFGANIHEGELICKLLPSHFAAAVGISLFAAVFASGWASLHAAQIQPSEGLRDA